MSAWSDAIVTRVAGLVEYRVRTGVEADGYVQALDGGVLELAEPLALACGTLGITLPLRDQQLAAVLERDAQPVPAGMSLRGVVLQLADGRLALSAGRGEVIESVGNHLAYVSEPEQGRYVQSWAIPGVEYWGVKKR